MVGVGVGVTVQGNSVKHFSHPSSYEMPDQVNDGILPFGAKPVMVIHSLPVVNIVVPIVNVDGNIITPESLLQQDTTLYAKLVILLVGVGVGVVVGIVGVGQGITISQVTSYLNI